MNKNWNAFFFSVCVLAGGFLLGSLARFSRENTQKKIQVSTFETTKPPLEIIEFNERHGDTITAEISDNVRIIWNKKIVEGAGKKSFSVAQLPTKDDLKLQDFPYTGNAKTNKFYNTSSYHARGTEVRYRRFFATQEAAKKAGFIPAKNLQ